MVDALEGIANSFTPEEREEAKALQLKIEEVTQVILDEKKSLDSNFVRLSTYVNEMRRKKYWLLLQFRTFGDYLTSIEEKFNLGKSQLYVGMNVTRNLLGSVSEEDIVDMGITKASVLSKYVEQSGQKTIPEEILAEALDSKVTKDQLEASVNAKLHNVLPEKGKWFSQPGFFCSDDEQAEILDAIELAKSIDPVIPNSIPHWQQMKEAYLRMAREFIGSYSACPN